MTTHEMTTPEPARGAGNHQPTVSYALSPCFLACFGGWTLNAMDVLIIRPAMPGIIDSFHVTKPDVVLIGTATLLTSAFGGWLAGALSDRVGRKPTLQWMILLFAGCTALCGLAQDFLQLFLLRVLMGIGFGGQWAAAAVMVGETCDKAHRGRWVGFLQCGWALGWGLAELLGWGLPKLLPDSLTHVAWRLLFCAGALPALPILWVTLFVKESPKFEEARNNLDAAVPARAADFLEIFSPTKLKAAEPEATSLTCMQTTFLTCMLSIGAQGGYYAIVLWLPQFLADQLPQFPVDEWKPSEHLVSLVVGSGAGYLVSAFLSDFLGRRWNFRLFAICAIVVVFAHLSILRHEVSTNEIPAYETIIVWLAFPLGFFASGTFAGMGAFFTELFPTRMGGSGVGFTYNFGRGFAALILWLIPGLAGARLLSGLWASLLSLLPPELSALLKINSELGLSIGVFVLIAYGLVFIATLLLPETRGKALDTKAE
jgi:MFS family permease